MERNFKLSQRVVADVKGFDPWPATVENIVANEDKKSVFYHVRLDGSSKSVPLMPESIKPLTDFDEGTWSSLCQDEWWHGARKRNEIIEERFLDNFKDSDFPPSLWDLIAVESDYEEVSDVDKANLKLSRVAHNAKIRYSELETKFTFHAMQQKFKPKKKCASDDYAYVLEKNGRKVSIGGGESKTVIRFPCPKCSRRFKTRMALKKHIEYTKDCSQPLNPTAKTPPTETPQQCPKCFSLYKNEELLWKHMVTHDKNAPKKKGGLRDYIRQIMSNNKVCRVPSYNPANGKSKTNSTNGKTPGQTKPLANKKEDTKKKKKASKISTPVESEEDSDSDDNSTSDADSLKSSAGKICERCKEMCCKCSKYSINGRRNQEAHSEREKERRDIMRKAFEEMASVLGTTKGCNSKNTLLLLAKDEIKSLEESDKQLEQTLNDLRDMNVRLVSREYQLSNSETN